MQLPDANGFTLSNARAKKSLTVTYSALSTVHIETELTEQSDTPAAVYATLTQQLSVAITSGQFATNLATSSAANNATRVAQIVPQSATYTEVEIVSPASEDSGSKKHVLSVGGIIGIVLAGVFVIVVLIAYRVHLNLTTPPPTSNFADDKEVTSYLDIIESATHVDDGKALDKEKQQQSENEDDIPVFLQSVTVDIVDSEDVYL